ncbi:MAG: hypothetical protein WCD79_16440 [Chthoniobacteraceae bacterium]
MNVIPWFIVERDVSHELRAAGTMDKKMPDGIPVRIRLRRQRTRDFYHGRAANGEPPNESADMQSLHNPMSGDNGGRQRLILDFNVSLMKT